jgi:dolichol kinase
MDWNWVGPSAVFWIAIAAIAIAGSYFGHRARIAKYKMMETLAEKGQTLPSNLTPELLEAVGREERHKNPVQSGIFMICVGIAIAVFFWALGGGGNLFEGEHVPNWLPVIGIFPFMIGVANLVGALFQKRPPKG